MLTVRGWSLVGATIALYIGGRIIGLGQLDALAAMGAVLVLASFAAVRLRSIDVVAHREVAERLSVGSEGRVDLTVRATHRRVPALLVTDSFDAGRRLASFRTATLTPGTACHGAYRVPTDRRGRHTLGPLEISVTDAFGLARRTVHTGGVDRVLVYPRVFDILSPPEMIGPDVTYESPPRRRRPQSGTEFLTLREYQVGDDLRRVHWASTARRDDLMIRQDESQHRSPVLVLLDVRESAHDHASFERAVEAAASVIRALELNGRVCALYSTSGRRIGHAGSRHVASVLDALAVIQPDRGDRISRTVLRRSAALVIAVVGRLTPADRLALAAIAGRPDSAIVVDACAKRAAGPLRPREVAAGENFVSNWNEMVLGWHVRPTRRSARSRSRV